ncbi:MAG: hypothetical protein LBQ02_00770 [Candidatus Nomurabacteria bacterium]|jgi:orotate phosphoribosyltransferase|nr:hypothetical protein [Candidatus Nomurabacteria bacterium]
MMWGKSIINALKELDAVDLEGHYKLASGKHSNAYIDLRVGLPYPKFVKTLSWALRYAIVEFHYYYHQGTTRVPDLLVGLGNAGPLLAYVTTEYLRNNNDGRYEHLKSIWCVSDGETFKFPPKMPFAQLVDGAKVIIVDDLLTTGSSMRKVSEFLQSQGAEVLAGVVAVKRSKGVQESDCGVPVVLAASELTESIDTYEEDVCPLCAQRVPMRRGVAHNDEFLKAHPDFPSV